MGIASPVSAPVTEPQGCTDCGTEPCTCSELRRDIRERGRLLAHEGFRQAESGRHVAALASFTEACSCGVQPQWLSEAAGLCALATSDVPAARRWWRAALAGNDSSPAGAWLASLETGDLHVALQAYNAALQSAQGGEYASAKRQLAQSLATLPEFAPARALDELLSSRAAEQPTAVSSPRSAAPRPSRTLAAWAGAAALAVVGAFWVGRATSEPTAELGAGATGAAVSVDVPARTAATADVLVPTASGATPSSTEPQERSRMLGIALSADADSVAALIEHIKPDTSAWPTTARSRVAIINARAARWHFARGRRATVQGAHATAVLEQEAAVRYSSGTYLADDALYELALAQHRAGRSADAAATAAHDVNSAHMVAVYSSSQPFFWPSANSARAYASAEIPVLLLRRCTSPRCSAPAYARIVRSASPAHCA